MPYEWVKPEVFLTAEESGDVPVYYCYRSGCVMQYHYQIESDVSQTCFMAFDVRDLANALGVRAGVTRDDHRAVVLAAVEEFGSLEAALVATGTWYEGETEG